MRVDGLTLLQEARAAGLTVAVEGSQLRIRGPRRAEPIAQQLIAHKPAVWGALAAEFRRDCGIIPANLPADWHLIWDEQAAIMEYDGHLPREQAEALALDDILDQMLRVRVYPGGRLVGEL